MADRDAHTGALLIKTVDGHAKRNPLIKIAADAAADMLLCARVRHDAKRPRSARFGRLRTITAGEV